MLCSPPRGRVGACEAARTLRAFDAARLVDLLQRCEVRRFVRNRTILRSGDPAGHVCFLLSGAGASLPRAGGNSRSSLSCSRPRDDGRDGGACGIPMMPCVRTIRESNILYMPGDIFPEPRRHGRGVLRRMLRETLLRGSASQVTVGARWGCRMSSPDSPRCLLTMPHWRAFVSGRSTHQLSPGAKNAWLGISLSRASG